MLYNDPTGHCPWCAGAIVGGALGFFGNLGYQMIKSYSSGESNNFKEAFQQVDWKEVAVYTVAGAVAGGTFGALSNGIVLATGVSVAVDTTSVTGAAFAGAVANVAGGQAGALTDATIDISVKAIDNKFIQKNSGYSMQDVFDDFMLDAYDAGFLNKNKIGWDIASGAVLAGLGQGFNNLTNSTDAVTYVTKAAREQNALFPGIVGTGSRVLSDYAQKMSSIWFDKKVERLDKMMK